MEPTITNFFDCLNKAGNKIAKNYLDNLSSYHHDSRDIANTYLSFFSKLAINPHQTVTVQNFYLDFLQKQHESFQNIFLNNQPAENSSEKPDKRFLAKEWTEYPYFNWLKQNYLLFEKLSVEVFDELEIDDKARKKLEFYNEQYLDMLSPANFLATNPEALKLAVETKGKSIWDGFNNLVHDIEKGRISQTDESTFEVGENLAITPGAVVYENELIQLIQYSPVTKKVHELPLLIIPPWINKFYILDLQPKNSFVKYLVEQGLTVYIISWRNPMPGMGDVSFDDYVSKGAIKAIEVVKEISNVNKINTLGYCLGGTLLSVASSILATKKHNPVNSITFLASMVDFSDIGPMGDVIDGALVRKLERGELMNDGVLHGHDMERAFNLIRANDLIWHYAVDNYLKGIKPSAFDVLYWTNDNTNLPADMYKYYMRQMILENKLSRKNGLTICDTPIDVSKINCPVFIIGLSEDYISPAKTVFATTQLVTGPVEFILGGSGHVVGVVNPPSKNKYGYYMNGDLGGSFDEWKKTAVFFEGSWWTPWTERLIEHSGKQIPKKEKLGDEKYKIIEPAPGSYVKERCEQEDYKLN